MVGNLLRPVLSGNIVMTEVHSIFPWELTAPSWTRQVESIFLMPVFLKSNLWTLRHLLKKSEKVTVGQTSGDYQRMGQSRTGINESSNENQERDELSMVAETYESSSEVKNRGSSKRLRGSTEKHKRLEQWR